MEAADAISPFGDSFLCRRDDCFFKPLACADVDMAGAQSIVAGIKERQLHAPLLSILHDILLKCERDIILADRKNIAMTTKFRK